MKRATLIIAACICYGFYFGLRGVPIVYSIVGGLITGVVLAAVAEAVDRLLRLFRRMAPGVASFIGTILFWLGVVVGIWCAGLSVYVMYEGASAQMFGALAGLAVFYASLGWGIRHALTADRWE